MRLKLSFGCSKQFNSSEQESRVVMIFLTSWIQSHLKELMPGLTAKVFRTYNVSITLDDMLNKGIKAGNLAENVVVYNQANKEVAIICNHQHSVSKSNSAQMTRLNEEIEELKVNIFF